jgi:hypothetical protein
VGRELPRPEGIGTPFLQDLMVDTFSMLLRRCFRIALHTALVSKLAGRAVQVWYSTHKDSRVKLVQSYPSRGHSSNSNRCFKLSDLAKLEPYKQFMDLWIPHVRNTFSA